MVRNNFNVFIFYFSDDSQPDINKMLGKGNRKVFYIFV